MADVLDAHLSGARAPLPREVIDYVLNATEFDLNDAWEGKPPADTRPWMTQAKRAVKLAEDIKKDGLYHDSHCWVFTPTSFLFLMEQLADTGYLNLGCLRVFDTGIQQHEFFVMLAPMPTDEAVRDSWSRARAELGNMQAEAASRELEQRARDRYSDEVQALRDEREILLAELSGMKHSKSWRFTAPLRDIRRWLGV